MRLDRVEITGGNFDAQQATIAAIGNSIKAGSEYLPIRNLAASLASRANPKDYLGQVKEIWRYIVTHWRYVRDPRGKELLTASPEAMFRLVLAGDRIGVGSGKGAGDCDCIAAAGGALLRAIGFPVRPCVVAPLGVVSGRLFTHVFLRVNVPRHGWISFDPVGFPLHDLGWTQPHSRIACYDLTGRISEYAGNLSAFDGDNKEVIDMTTARIPDLAFWPDYGGLGEDTPETGLPQDWRTYSGPYFEPSVGPIIDGIGLGGLSAEVDTEIAPDGSIRARTPMLSLDPDDLRYVRVMGEPRDGTIAIGDDGSIYQYDGSLGAGFFKRLFRKIKKGFRRITKGLKALIRKLPGGKYLVKLGEKLHAIAMKVVRPLIKIVGKYAAKLAPVAALIGGPFGPAIAGGLLVAGKVAKLMHQFDVATVGKPGSVRKLAFGDPKKAFAFKAALHQEAKKEHARILARKRARAAAVRAKRAPAPVPVYAARPVVVPRRAAPVSAARRLI